MVHFSDNRVTLRFLVGLLLRITDSFTTPPTITHFIFYVTLSVLSILWDMLILKPFADDVWRVERVRVFELTSVKAMYAD